MSTDIKPSKVQLSKIIQSGRFLGRTLGNMMSSNLDKKALLDLAVPLDEDVLPKLATKSTSSVLDKLKRKIIGQGDIRAGKGLSS